MSGGGPFDKCCGQTARQDYGQELDVKKSRQLTREIASRYFQPACRSQSRRERGNVASVV
jgi:hypothetical protein